MQLGNVLFLFEMLTRTVKQGDDHDDPHFGCLLFLKKDHHSYIYACICNDLFNYFN